jgi:uridine kinase
VQPDPTPTPMRQTFGDLATVVRDSEPLLGPTRLVVVDGPAGSGKTTFAAHLAAALGGAQVVHMDDLFEGWSGLRAGLWQRLHDQVLRPLLAGGTGRYRRYDWDAAAFAEEHDVPAAETLVIEGVGAGERSITPHASLVVWVEAPEELRLQRGLRRDGAALYPEWVRWLRAEERYFTIDRTRKRADLVVDGTTGEPTAYAVIEDRRPS